jgi:aminoglycoside phosphotransferase (APT) family kinase protein
MPGAAGPKNLTVDTAAPYLLAHDLVTVAAIVDGDLEIVDAGRRNQNLKVIRRHGPSYLVKQPGEGERGTLATLAAEVAFYEQCRGIDAMRALLPALCASDPERGLIALTLVDGRPLWGQYAIAPEADFLSHAAAPLGSALGTVHRTFRESADASWAATLSGAQPWVLGVHKPTPDIFATLSPANLHVLRAIQRSAPIVAGLDLLRASWSPDTLIHNDLKGDNVLIWTRDGQTRVSIVDWEMVQRGDPAWDVGAMLRDFLGYWLNSVPLSSDMTPDDMLAKSTWPLSRLHPAARAFWQAYRASTALDAADAGEFLLRCVRSAAARLVQSAYELSLTGQQIANLSLAMLQLAANIFTNPHEASLHLFGIPAPWRRPEHARSAG